MMFPVIYVAPHCRILFYSLSPVFFFPHRLTSSSVVKGSVGRKEDSVKQKPLNVAGCAVATDAVMPADIPRVKGGACPFGSIKR